MFVWVSLNNHIFRTRCLAVLWIRRLIYCSFISRCNLFIIFFHFFNFISLHKILFTWWFFLYWSYSLVTFDRSLLIFRNCMVLSDISLLAALYSIRLYQKLLNVVKGHLLSDYICFFRTELGLPRLSIPWNRTTLRRLWHWLRIFALNC